MEVFRVYNPDVVLYMKFFDNENSTQAEDANELRLMMTQDPSNTCVVVIVDETEIVGHSCGYKYPDQDYVWSFNSWVKAGVDKILVQQGFDIIKKWTTEFIGLTEIRCKTSRNPKVMGRAYGWKTHVTIMTLQV